MEILVPEAAKQLGISESRVRALIRAGDLPARQLAGRWFIDPANLDPVRDRRAGRPFAPRIAWGLISLIERGDAPELDRIERSKLRRRLREQPDIEAVAPMCRRRNDLQGFRVHPGGLDRVRSYDGAVLAGASADGQPVIDLARVEIYLPEDRLDGFIRSMHAERVSSEANVLVRVPQARWPFPDGIAGRASIALDLHDIGDARSRREARGIWHRELAAGRFEELRR